MKCRDCIYMKPVGANGLYICDNYHSNNFGEYTGICCEDECDDGKYDDDDDDVFVDVTANPKITQGEI